jgi:hypothetical protein
VLAQQTQIPDLLVHFRLLHLIHDRHGMSPRQYPGPMTRGAAGPARRRILTIGKRGATDGA